MNSEISMDVQTLVQSWIRWSEEHLPLTGDIPKINIESPVPDWIENSADALTIAIDHRERLLTCFMNYLTDDPLNIPARFTALSVYYALTGKDSSDELLEFVAGQVGLDSTELEMGRAEYSEDYKKLADDCERRARKLIDGFNKDFRLLVRQLNAEDIPRDWRVIRWEILNSYAAADWNRALKLYNIAEESNLLDIGDLQIMRGQFRYLQVFGAEMWVGLDLLWWEPKLLSLEDSNKTLIVLMSGFSLGEIKAELTPSSIDLLRDASNDLEKALNKRPKLSRLYGPMLARCYFLTGRLYDAVMIYEKSLTEWTADVIRRRIYESLRFVYRESHLPEKTIELLERWAGEFPDEKGIHMQIAELQAQLGNLEAVPLSLRKEVDRNPEADRDWRITTLLALGETRDVSQQLLTELKSDSAKFSLITSLLEEYWPGFAGLSNKARDQWINGIYLGNHPVPEPFRAVWSGNAGHAHANAVELELNSRVFSKFRESVIAARSVKELAAERIDEKGESKVILPFIRKDRPYTTKNLTLGEMAFVVDHCKRSQVSILQELKGWIEANCPGLLEQSENLYKVTEFRNKPAHGNISEIPSESIPSICRQIIDSLARQ